MGNKEQRKDFTEQRNKNGDRRGTHPNSLKNLVPFVKGQSGNPKGRSVSALQGDMYDESCPFDGQHRTWREALAEGGMRQALTTPVALSNLLDRQEGKVTLPISGSLEITDTKELTDEQLAIIAATNILKNNTSKRSRRITGETARS